MVSRRGVGKSCVDWREEVVVDRNNSGFRKAGLFVVLEDPGNQVQIQLRTQK